MKLGIFAKTFPGKTPLAVLSAARAAGYSAVQYNMSCSGLDPLPLEITAEAAAAVSAASAETGVEIAAVSATYNIVHPDRAVRERGLQAFNAIAGAARQMGTRLLTVCSGTCDAQDQWRYHPGNETLKTWDETCREFARLIAIADAHDIDIGVEPELANVINSAEKAHRLIDTLESERIRIVLDPANLVEVAFQAERRNIINAAIDLLDDRIALAHAKDRTEDGIFATPGRGVIDFTHFAGALRRAKFGGALVAHGFGADEARDVAIFLTEHLHMAQAL